jgi:protein-disulfide isomerase
MVWAVTVACDGGGPTGPNVNQQPPGTVRPLTAVVVTTPVAAADNAPYDALPQDGLALGSAEAPVTLDIYTNFLCSNCAIFGEEILPLLVRDFVPSGQARFVFHHAPLGGEGALRAHEASHCAADQDRFWQAFAQLYENFSQQTEAYSEERLRTMMMNAGVESTAFEACFVNHEHRSTIEGAVAAFGQLQRQAGAGFAAATAQAQQRPLLPVVFVNERAIVAPTYEELRAMIEEELP